MVQSGRALLAAVVLLAQGAGSALELQSREDAWWTGPMLAPSGATLPQGHALIEPYLFDVVTNGRIDRRRQPSRGAHRPRRRLADLHALRPDRPTSPWG